MKKYLKGFLLFLGLIFIGLSLKASHMQGADLWYTWIGPNTYKITVTFYKDCNGFVDMGPTLTGVTVESASGCGPIQQVTMNIVPGFDSVEVSPLCPAQIGQSSCNNGNLSGTVQFRYEGIVTLPAECSDWKVIYQDCCRNAAITNIGNGTAPDTYGWRVEALIDNTNGNINSSPSFTSLPIPSVCANQLYNYNHGAFDIDGDSLVYSLINPLDWNTGNPIPYNTGLSPNYPLTTTTGNIAFDPSTGQASFTANGPQITVVTVLVQEYRNGVLVGSSMRDIQIQVTNCTNQTPILNVNPTNITGGFLTGTSQSSASFEVCPGQSLSFGLSASDPDANDSLFASTNLATVIPGANFSYTGVNPINIQFDWQPSGLDTGFHSFTLTVKDNACPTYGVNVYSFQIYVLAGTSAGPDITLCGAQTTQLQATGGNQFVWSPATYLSATNISNPVCTATVTTTYTVTSNLTSGCDNSDEVVVFYVPDFTYSISNGDSLCLGQSLQLNISGSAGGSSPYTYQWTPALGLSSNTISNPLATPTVSTTYSVTITSAQGCQKSDTIHTFIAGATPQFTLLPVDTVCSGTQVQLQAVVGGSTSNCTPTFSINCSSNDYIENFSFNTIVNNFSGCNGNTSPQNYIYYPSGTFTTTVDPGSTYNISMQAGATFGQGFGVWIDYNQNGSFADAGEFVFTSGASGTQVFSGTVTIPATASPGPTRLRVLCRYATVPTANDYCIANASFGECEDYDIFINGAGTITYDWQPAAGLSDPTIPNPIAAPVQTTTYTLTVSYGGLCPKIDSVIVPVKTGTSSYLGDTLICYGNEVKLNPPAGATQFSWTSNPLGLISSDPNPLVQPLVNTVFYFSGVSLSTCIQDSFNVFVTPLPATLLSPSDTTICYGDTVLIGSYSTYTSYSWQPSATLISPNANETFAYPLTATTYTLSVSDNNGCATIDSIIVDIHPAFYPKALSDTSICPGTSAQLGVDSYVSYFWRPSNLVSNAFIQNPTSLNGDTVEYIVYVTDNNGCEASDTMIVNVFPSYVVSVGPDVDLIPGQNVTLDASIGIGGTYTWLPIEGLDSPNGSAPIASPSITTTYTVIVTDFNGCSSTDNIVVNVVPTCLGFAMPNAFSPNGDGKNDEYEFTPLGIDEFVSISIYNRWGERVFESSSKEYKWDGNYYWGKKAEIGVYVYRIEYICEGETTIESGTISLLR
jgi:gliding motility-associated-like protein